MIDDPTHKLDAYRDNNALVAFCKVCSAEGEFLAQPCPGKFVPNRERVVDSNRELK